MSRLNRFKQNLLSHSLDAALISKKESLYYLSGLVPQHPTEREAFLLVTPTRTVLYHSPFIDIGPKRLDDHLEYLPMSSTTNLSQLLNQLFSGATTVGIEKNNLTVSEYERTQAALPDKSFETVDSLIEHQRMNKDASEQKLLHQAGQVAHQAMTWIHHRLSQPKAVGLTELQVAQLIDAKLLTLGADEPAFPTIVAFDHNTAKPHHRPGSTTLKPDSMILIDMGASLSLYKSDMTRTWSRGTPPPLFADTEKLVFHAYDQALAAACPGVPAHQVDQAARTTIAQAGFADNFIHSTGHGIGLEAHEIPHVSTIDITPLDAGVAFTIEPGVYRQFGYRHENTFIMTETGPVSTTD